MLNGADNKHKEAFIKRIGHIFERKNKPNDLGKNLRHGRGKMSKVEVI